MFDNLKESLGNFRKDVEEEAEVEEADAEASEAEAAEAEDDTGEADEEPTGEAEAEEAAAEFDADETAVDDPDDVDADEGGGEADASEGDAAAESPEPVAAAAPDTDAPGGVDAGVTAETDEAGGSVEADASVETDESAGTGESDEADEPDEEQDAEDDDGGPGLGARAKSLATGKVYIDEDDLEGPLRDLEFALLENDVEMGVAEAITDHLREELVGERRTVTTRTGSVVEDALQDALLDVLSVGQFDLIDRIEATDEPAVIVFTGVNGVGKTTSIAKVSQFLEEHGYSSVLANGDTFRAGANEQIAEHADALGRKLISHDRGGDPAAVIYDAVEYADAHGIDVVLGDTAGRLHTDEGLMDQLEKIGRVVGPDLTIFVDEAVAGQDAVNRAREFDEAATIDGAILTKADADASGGAAISVAHVTGKPILFLGVGQEYDDLERFDPEAMVDRLLE